MNTQTPMTIGAVARRVGVAIDTIRYYEREGLLPEPLRRASGYRSYDEGAVRQLRFIRRAKDLGFTLEEIRDLLALSADRQRGVKAVKKRAEERLAAIDERGDRRFVNAGDGNTSVSGLHPLLGRLVQSGGHFLLHSDQERRDAVS